MEADSPEHKDSRPFSTFSRESSLDEDDELNKDRRNIIVPLTRSPFIDPDPASKHDPDELVVTVSEVPWGDLLLEIAMTTAFASLTDGTPILEGSNVASYLGFFALVWWVWASQVAYNVRFRQSDWLHRLFVFFQLLVFCALAAFTNNFDMTNGIKNDSAEEKKLMEYQLADFASRRDIDVVSFRNNRMPILNARGISLTMAFSRLLLLAQYMLAFSYAIRKDGGIRSSKTSAFLIHIETLALFSLCYFIAYGIVGKSPDKADEIAKLLLWYVPLLAEVASHFIAASRPGRVRYPAQAIYERSSTVFIIILGGGLDKITNGFQYIVGNISLGFKSAGLILCGVVIFILLFSLYFGTSEGDKLGSRRALARFFFQFFYLSAVIVTLQGIAAMLEAGNIGNALETPFQFVRDTKKLLETKGFGAHLNESDYDYEQTFNLEKTGVALTSLLDWVNYGVDTAVNQTDYNLTYNYLLQMDVYIIMRILHNFAAMPDDDSILYAKLSAFYDNDPGNYTLVNNQTFKDLAENVVTTNATPALWFYAAGGSVLVTLALMCLINQWPRDKYEWGQTISRLVLGLLIVIFTAVDVHASDDVLDDDLRYQGLRIWYLATHSWVLPPYALALVVEQLIELMLLYLARCGLNYSGFSTFSRMLPRMFSSYAPARTSDHGDNMQAGRVYDEAWHHDHEIIFDPYKPYKKTQNIPPSRPVTAVMTSPPIGAPSFESQPQIQGQGQGRGGGNHPSRPRHMYRHMSSESSVQPLISC